MTDYYVKPREKRVPCNVRIPKPLNDDLLAVLRWWRLKASSEGHNPDALDRTFVCERLLTVGVDGVWAEIREIIGHEGAPRGDTSWDKLRVRLSKPSARSRKANPRDFKRQRLNPLRPT